MRYQKLVGTAVTAALAATMLFGTSGAASAATAAPPMEAATPASSPAMPAAEAGMDEFIQRADPFVSVADGKFALDESAASGVLTLEEIALANRLIDASNSTQTTGSSDTDSSTMGAGVTKLEVQWFGYRVYISKGVVNSIGAGVTIAGIWVPVVVVRGVLATLGTLAGAAPHGIVFNWTPVAVPGIPGTIFGAGWQ